MFKKERPRAAGDGRSGDFDPEGTVAFRESVKRGEAIGPRVLTAGPYFDHRPSQLDWIRGVNSAVEARQLFDAWKGRIDGVKLVAAASLPNSVVRPQTDRTGGAKAARQARFVSER